MGKKGNRMDDINISFSRPEESPEISVIKVSGYVDTTTSAELEESLKRVLKKGMFKVIIDLGGVNYISSAGWGIFISEIKNIRENGGDLKLAAMVPDVYEVFELLEFQTILECFDSVDEAVRSFDTSQGPKGKKTATDDEGVEVESSSDAKIES